MKENNIIITDLYQKRLERNTLKGIVFFSLPPRSLLLEDTVVQTSVILSCIVIERTPNSRDSNEVKDVTTNVILTKCNSKHYSKYNAKCDTKGF